MTLFKDWGEVSSVFDSIKESVQRKKLASESEAQTRFDVIDRIIKDVLQWQYGQISVEEYDQGTKQGYVDYLLRSGDHQIIVEAKKSGASFPTPTRSKRLKLTGQLLGQGEIHHAIKQAEAYAVSKEAEIVIVTNGVVWCIYRLDEDNRDSTFAELLFPFSNENDIERLFDIISCEGVENGSLSKLTNENPIIYRNTLLEVVKDSDSRIDRNNIADHISPALDHALHSESILNDKDKLEFCFVSTEARVKFDTQLNMHLSDYKPIAVAPARRIRKNKATSELDSLVRFNLSKSSPPVTLVIGSVGAGKSTYLKHFELIKGEKLINKENCHWVYIDFEEMGKSGKPRSFVYDKLNEYLLHGSVNNPIDYDTVIRPAYEDKIQALARGPFGGISKNIEKFEEKISEIIHSDYEKIEPYVDTVFRYLSDQNLCVIVLDNIDLFEDDELETLVFSESISISKKQKANILVSIRDTTFVKHRNDAIFNAFELKKLWLDPPPFKEVLSKRLSFSRNILKNKRAEIVMSNNFKLVVPDLGFFFEIVNKSLLDDINGRLLESLADRNIRRGISYVRNFLTSGHIQADKAINNYLNQEANYKFPYHEVFKGAMLGQWKFYKEDRAEILNLFDSKLNNKSLQFLRLYLLGYLYESSKQKQTLEVPVEELVEVFSVIGASKNSVVLSLKHLQSNSLIYNNKASDIDVNSTINITTSGGYYYNVLANRLVYVEAIMHDTIIYDDKHWDRLSDLTMLIDKERNILERLKYRKDRLSSFMNYCSEIENINKRLCQLSEQICAHAI